jgi:SpoVK/Ycf46/Vps4 family AAA+-type ATPase
MPPRLFTPDERETLGCENDAPTVVKDDILITSHERSNKLCSAESFDKNASNLTVIEKTYYDYLGLDIIYYKFFSGDHVSHTEDYSILRHNVRMYALYNLMKTGDIKIEAFSSAASTTALPISYSDSVTVPGKGAFVVTLTESLTELILELEPYPPRGIEWSLHAKKSEDFQTLETLIAKSMRQNNMYSGKVFDQFGKFLSLPKCSFGDIYLDKELKDEIQLHIINYFDSKKRAIKKKNNIPLKRGAIFSGNPGTGKTFLSRVLANSLDSTFMVVTRIEYPDELMSYFDFMKQFDNGIILFEDIDIYVPDRKTNSPIVSAMLNGLDGLAPNDNLMVICTTNEVEVLDYAIKDRPGRFDRVFNFPCPNWDIKKEMLTGFCSKHDITAVNMEHVIDRVPESYTGAHLKELYITAVTIALEEGSMNSDEIAILTTELFEKAIVNMKSRARTKTAGFHDKKK